MSSTNPDVVVLRGNAHGMSSERADGACASTSRDIRLAETPGEERELVASAPVATCFRLDPEVLENADSLRLFATASAGIGHLPLDELARRAPP